MTDQASFPGAPGARIAIADLESGQAVDGAYACSEKTTATDRNGKAYLRLKLRDASGEVAAIHFDPSDEALGVKGGDVVIVGQMNEDGCEVLTPEPAQSAVRLIANLKSMPRRRGRERIEGANQRRAPAYQ